jgi:Zn-dependent M28 family amino/carboxypeptidase
MDMVGRGSAWDRAGGGDDYLQLVGSRRLSTELGDIVESVNSTSSRPLRFDYSWDANGHPQRIYCRSDHYNYARHGIPIAFFTTGLHMDYHQLTDEPQYIDYERLRRISQLVHDVAVRVGNLDHRVRVDKPKPDPMAACVQ